MYISQLFNDRSEPTYEHFSCSDVGPFMIKEEVLYTIKRKKAKKKATGPSGIYVERCLKSFLGV